MSIAENEKIAYLWFEVVWSKSDPGGILDEIVHPDYQPDKSLFAKKGAKQLREEIQQARATFPDMKNEILEMDALPDKVWVRSKATGTHKGNFLGFPASGNIDEVEGLPFCILKITK